MPAKNYYRWRLKFGARKEDEARRLKALEQENSRLNQIVAELTLDISMLKDLVSGPHPFGPFHLSWPAEWQCAERIPIPSPSSL